MNKEKQIEEMEQIIYDNTEQDTMWTEIYDCANALYNAGYRKASELAGNIFEEIDMLIVRRMIADSPFIDDRLIHDIAKLRKKFTEEEG